LPYHQNHTNNFGIHVNRLCGLKKTQTCKPGSVRSVKTKSLYHLSGRSITAAI